MRSSTPIGVEPARMLMVRPADMLTLIQLESNPSNPVAYTKGLVSFESTRAMPANLATTGCAERDCSSGDTIVSLSGLRDPSGSLVVPPGRLRACGTAGPGDVRVSVRSAPSRSATVQATRRPLAVGVALLTSSTGPKACPAGV
jgi:hypothetical protein